MPPSLLDRLTTDSFHLSVGFTHTPSYTRRALQRSIDVRRIACALRFGEISEKEIREFVESITAKFKSGKRLDDDLALAAIAVVLEMRSSEFAEEYLHDLSRLRLAEMATSIGVACECLMRRYTRPKHQNKKFSFPSDSAIPPGAFVSSSRSWSDGTRPRSGVPYPSVTEAV